MIPEIAMGVASAIPQVMKLITAARQAKEADALTANSKRPVYNIPGAQQEATVNARNQAYNKNLPGQSTMEDKIGSTFSNAAAAATQKGNPADTLATISAMQGNANNAQNSLNGQAAQFQEGNMDKLNNQLGQTAAYQDKQFQVNEMEPYIANARAASALKNASILNEQNGITGLGAVGAQAASSAISPTNGGVSGTSPTGFSQSDQDLMNAHGLTLQQLQSLRNAGKL